MTLMYELGLDILKVYLHTKNELSKSRLSKVRTRTVQTYTQTQTDVIKRITMRNRGW